MVLRSICYHLVKDTDIKIESEEEVSSQKSHDRKEILGGGESAIDIEVNMISIKRMIY